MTWLWRKLVRQASGRTLERADLPADAALGRRGEEAAYWYLRDHGFVMVDRNYRPEGLSGEIDLIGWDGDTLVFVEVKTRSSVDIVTPENAVDHDKQIHVTEAASQYRSRSGASSRSYRFDVISVYIPGRTGERRERKADSREIRIQHFRDAFARQRAG